MYGRCVIALSRTYLYISTYVLTAEISFTHNASCSFIFTLFGNRLISESASIFNYRDLTYQYIFIFTGVSIIVGIVTRSREPVGLRHKMGNSKSKKVKISDEQSQSAQTTKEESRERINSLKTDVTDGDVKRTNEELDGENRDKDNASSASTVEVLDDK